MPFFSILTPVYKVEKYLNACIDSVLNQTYGDFELILVDDGSPDNSGKICDDYAQKDSRIKVIHKENGGLISARREAVKHASGEYCVFLDSDDFVENNILEILFAKISEHNCDVVCYGYNKVDQHGAFLHSSEDIKSECLIEEKREFCKRVFMNNLMNVNGFYPEIERFVTHICPDHTIGIARLAGIKLEN